VVLAISPNGVELYFTCFVWHGIPRDPEPRFPGSIMTVQDRLSAIAPVWQTDALKRTRSVASRLYCRTYASTSATPVVPSFPRTMAV
jgi:hypothetical protein